MTEKTLDLRARLRYMQYHKYELLAPSRELFVTVPEDLEPEKSTWALFIACACLRYLCDAGFGKWN
jgi:hypothetical protein